VPAATASQQDKVGAIGLFVVTVLAALAGMWFTRSNLSPRLVTTLGLLMGLVLATTIVGRLLPPPSLFLREIGYAARWLDQSLTGELGWPLPFAAVAGHVWQQCNELILRLWWWGQTAASSGTTQDNIVLQLLSALFLWISGLFAFWQLYRRRRPLVALLPGGLALAVVAFFRGGMSIFYLLTYLGCTLCLLAICHLWDRIEHWEQTATDYPGDMLLELALGLGPWFVVLMLLASFFPVLHPRQIRDAFWEVMHEPWARVEEVSERLFGPLAAAGSAVGGNGGSLPRAHLLGGGPELAETIVLYVTTNDPPPLPPEPGEQPQASAPDGPRRYWRGITYDTYAAQGWSNSPLEAQTTPAGEFLGPDHAGLSAQAAGGESAAEQSPSLDFELSQRFELLAQKGLLYAANAPMTLDHPVQSWRRTSGDLALISSEASDYTVQSRPPQPTAAELRETGAIMPPELGERYLALPESVPQRVLDLAQEVAGEGSTGYDRAHALESFLRTYTYTLELPPPPAETDVVDYFLFDLQEGYCDYYASAMVVMARAVGLPARLAAGYAQGTYDQEAGRWVVTEKDGHSWVEVYFEDIGWVEFEPTAGLPALARPGGQIGMPAVPPLPARTTSQSRIPWTLAIIAAVLLLLAVTILWIWRAPNLRDGSPGDLVRDRHGRLLRWGTRLGHPYRDAQTAIEYGVALSDGLHTRGRDTRWPQVRRASDDILPEIQSLTETYVRAQYSPDPITPREGWRIRDLWIRLRRHLWWLVLGSRR
jgi:transglutaminase-like putative cysteine protease